MALRCGAPAAVAAQRKRVGESGCFDARDGFHTAEHFIEVSILLALRGVLASRIYAQRGRPFRPEAEVDVEDSKETSHQQAGPGQQHTREGDLGNHQRAANPAPLPAFAETAAGIFQRVVERGGRNLNRRR